MVRAEDQGICRYEPRTEVSGAVGCRQGNSCRPLPDGSTTSSPRAGAVQKMPGAMPAPRSELPRCLPACGQAEACDPSARNEHAYGANDAP